MSNQKMREFNIKSVRSMKDCTLISDTSGDEWRIVGTSLYHLNNRSKRGNMEYHFQCKVKSFYHCLGYIKSHSQKYITPKSNSREIRMNYLFSII